MMNRISKDEYYLSIADVVLKRSTCLRRNYGVVIVKNDEIVATGYTRRGQRYHICRSVQMSGGNSLHCWQRGRRHICQSTALHDVQEKNNQCWYHQSYWHGKRRS